MSENYNNQDNSNMPQEGTPEYHQMMQEHYGQNYQFGFRIGFGQRLAAALIDWLIITILTTIVMYASGTFENLTEIISDLMANPDSFDFNSLETTAKSFAPIAILMYLMYFSIEIFKATSVGKMIFNLQIANENMEQASFNALLTRYLIKHSDRLLSIFALITAMTLFDALSSLTTLVLVIGLFVTLGEKRQAFHDMFSKTAVFHKENIKSLD